MDMPSMADVSSPGTHVWFSMDSSNCPEPAGGEPRSIPATRSSHSVGTATSVSSVSTLTSKLPRFVRDFDEKFQEWHGDAPIDEQAFTEEFQGVGGLTRAELRQIFAHLDYEGSGT